MIDVIVARKRSETEDICLLELARPDGAALPPFSAGAHIDIHLPGGLIRQYSLCNHPGEQHRYEVAVLRDPKSRGGSIAVHDQVNEGDAIVISEPRNLFPLEHSAHRHLLIAGGIGVTPILCMAERLSHQGAEFEMHYCTKAPEQTAFRERISASEFADRVSFHYSRAEPSTRLDAQALLSKPQPDTHLYVCGPNPFMDHILETAHQCGWSDAQLHREYFAAEEVDHEGDSTFEVQLASSGDVIEIPADRSVLEVLLERDIDIPFACENGVCGTCVTRLLEGEPDHRDMFLTPEEKATNEEFAPCCSRSKSKRLVLDI
ncbi:Flavodoxin reductases (ferredoxin-NADPH reductases) family 1 [Marinobacterium lacunae]|uniref:Flavodoxin reductases (Ferredoxin-NADPH reductases) family 1 n=1 Tax=Marinobacterium lacunae TaxID=1232683 RepID=A0A081G1N8_9GAMM|nr:PDR/VanB family oxidoreductase [Marinobacterium lacunae]KEA64693.1 Flavodoxin reductases (ferredoxin-NADPH reductases) family 1 [Marinobacterium lacunae]MBR9883869.1 oxidoreductase [Oceanospirillales bacterium]